MRTSNKFSCAMFGLALFSSFLASCSAPAGSGDETTASSNTAKHSTDVEKNLPGDESSAPRIVDYGPRNITAGVPFNKQPGGQAAVWVRMSSSLEGTDGVIQINGATLQSSIHNSQITALVPDDMYAKSGELTLRVVRHKDGTELRSGAVTMIVH